MLASDASLRITEIFLSLQGESSWSGRLTTFVRLTGCPLRCNYCDTAYAFQGGRIESLATIEQQVASHQARYVCVTGGEPLAQPNCLPLLQRLCDSGYKVSLETSGAIDVTGVDSRVKKIVDLKAPSSGEEQKNNYHNIDHLTLHDELKFVVANRQDYEWAVGKIAEYRLDTKVGELLFSPVVSIGQDVPSMSARDLADWIVADKLDARMQLQMHKILWNDAPGH